MILLNSLFTLICMWGFGYFTLCCPFWSAVQEQMSPPVNFFLVALWTTVMTQSPQPTPASVPIALSCSVVVSVFQVVFLLWELLSFPSSLRFLLRLYVPLTKSGSFVNAPVVCTADNGVQVLVLFLHCLLLALFFKRKAKRRTWVCALWISGTLCFPSCASCCCVCWCAAHPVLLLLLPIATQQKSLGWDLAEALHMLWKLSSNLNHGRAGKWNSSCTSVFLVHELLHFHEFSPPFSWVSLGTRVGNNQLGKHKETTLKYLSRKPLFKQCPVRTSVAPGCLQSAGRNWKFLWLLLTESCVLGAHSAPSWGIKSTFR